MIHYVLLYPIFLVLTLIACLMNKSFIEDTKPDVYKQAEWHLWQEVFWVSIYIAIFSSVYIVAGSRKAFPVLVRIGAWSLMYSFIYDVILNWMRGEKWNHQGQFEGFFHGIYEKMMSCAAGFVFAVFLEFV